MAVFLNIISKASQTTAEITRRIPGNELMPVADPTFGLMILMIAIPDTVQIIPITFLKVRLSFRMRKARIDTTAGVELVIIPLSMAVVYFKP